MRRDRLVTVAVLVAGSVALMHLYRVARPHDAILGDITNPLSAIKDFVIRRSDGSPLYNLAVSVDDLDGEHERCYRLGLNPTPIKELMSDGQLAVRFFFLEDPDGYKVEVVQRQGRYV